METTLNGTFGKVIFPENFTFPKLFFHLLTSIIEDLKNGLQPFQQYFSEFFGKNLANLNKIDNFAQFFQLTATHGKIQPVQTSAQKLAHRYS